MDLKRHSDIGVIDLRTLWPAAIDNCYNPGNIISVAGNKMWHNLKRIMNITGRKIELQRRFTKTSFNHFQDAHKRLEYEPRKPVRRKHMGITSAYQDSYIA